MGGEEEEEGLRIPNRIEGEYSLDSAGRRVEIVRRTRRTRWRIALEVKGITTGDTQRQKHVGEAVTNGVVSIAATVCPLLTYPSVRGCGSVSIAHLATELSAKCPRLLELDARECRSDLSLVELGSMFPRLIRWNNRKTKWGAKVSKWGSAKERCRICDEGCGGGAGGGGGEEGGTEGQKRGRGGVVRRKRNREGAASSYLASTDSSASGFEKQASVPWPSSSLKRSTQRTPSSQ